MTRPDWGGPGTPYLTESPAHPAPVVIPTTSPYPAIRQPISRSGLWVMILGTALIGVGALVGAVEYYLLATGSSFAPPNFQQFELALAIEYYFGGLGVLVATGGWIADRRSIDRARGAGSSASFRVRSTAGFVLIAIGAFMVSLFPFVYGSLAFQAYESTPSTLFTATYVAGFEIASSVGMLVILAGWSLHHSAVLTWTESHPG